LLKNPVLKDWGEIGKNERRDMEAENWGRGKMRYHLEQKGYATLIEIDEKFGLSVSTTSDAIRYPKPKGEAVFAKIIGVHPMVIWPRRYDTKGERLKPQPVVSYSAQRVVGQCQKSEAA